MGIFDPTIFDPAIFDVAETLVGTTLAQIKADVLRYMGPRADSIFKRLSQPLTTTSTAADAGKIVDTQLVRGSADTTDFHRCQIEIIDTVGAGPTADTAGAISGVSNTGLVTATGVLSVNPNFGAIPQSATRFLLYPPNMSPENLTDAIKEVCRSTYAPALWIPSLCLDADFESADLANWPDAVGTPTQAFVTDVATILFGERTLKVITTVLGDGIHNLTAIPVTQNEQLLVSVAVSCTVGSVKVQLYDVTNGAEIHSVTVDEDAFTDVRFYATVPTGCQNVRVRFLSATAASTWYITPSVVVQSTTERFYPAPSWFESEEQILDALYLRQGWASTETDSYAALSRSPVVAQRPRLLRWDRGVNPLLIEGCAHGNGVYMLEVGRPFAELLLNADTSKIDREYVKWKTIGVVTHTHVDDDWQTYNHTAARIARVKRYGERKMYISSPREVAV